MREVFKRQQSALAGLLA